jgi:hypothetical protein
MRSTEPGCLLQIACLLGLFGKLLRRRRGALTWFHGAWSLWKALEEEGCIDLVSFHGVWTCGVEVLEY